MDSNSERLSCVQDFVEEWRRGNGFETVGRPLSEGRRNPVRISGGRSEPGNSNQTISEDFDDTSSMRV